ncbi:MAG: OsmC family protein [Rikenellaceae bacterium]|nr:OsmC family protein [Rikenellaceae bacterium]MCL2691887.1 OsmC family protein [Rikenellaceae bacterium]
MAIIETIYLGDLRTEITHLQSGNKVMTDAPTDNNGRGEYISPTDMVAAALGSCIATIMAMSAARYDIDLRGARMEIDKVMQSEPRRIAEIKIDFYFPGDYDAKTKTILERVADACPVSKSLHPELRQIVNFHYNTAESK